MWMGVGCPCPPVHNDIVTPRHLFYFIFLASRLSRRLAVALALAACIIAVAGNPLLPLTHQPQTSPRPPHYYRRLYTATPPLPTPSSTPPLPTYPVRHLDGDDSDIRYISESNNFILIYYGVPICKNSFDLIIMMNRYSVISFFYTFIIKELIYLYI